MKGFIGAELATKSEVNAIQTKIDDISKLYAKQIEDEKLIQGQKVVPTAILQRLEITKKTIAVRDDELLALVVKATKTYYTRSDEPAITGFFPGSDWDGLLQKLADQKGGGKDQFGHEKTSYVNPHAHHIVMKTARSDEGKYFSFLARSILWSNKINPYVDFENLAWARNWSHSSKYAVDVLNRLKSVKTKGKLAIYNVLSNVVDDFNDGLWSVKNGGQGDDV